MLKHSKGQWAWFIKTVITALFLSLFFCFIQSAYAVCDIKTNGRNFACLDNSRFFWMGDTSWTFSTSDLPCGTSCSSGDFAGYVDVRAAQGFNVIQGNIFHYPKAAEPGRNADEDVKATNENNNSPFCTKSGSQCTSNCTNVAVNSWSYDCPNPAYYQNVKNRIAYMNSQGIIAAIAPGWGANFDCSSIPGVPGAPAWTTAQINSYYDYLAGYFGNANPDLQIIWLVSSNTNSAGPANCSNVTWQSLAARINNVDDNDGQAHLITIHPKASPPGGYDIAQLQNQPCEDPTPVTDNLGGVPVVDGEFNYEVTDSCWDYKTDPNSSCQETNFSGLTSDGACSCDASVNENHHAKPDIVLYGAWSVVMRGGYFTYGNASTYYKFADKSNCIDDKQSTAADDMTILYDFFNNHPDGTVKWNETGFGPKNPPLSSAEDEV
ncbi:MAG TPA: DUF4038 domain-containing protein [Acidobacteriota bacterium]|nr:DUF4038 domain-containing protein [Acidobacteriota bacterium]